ncbi:MAG: glycine zipper family protein [Rhodobacteraceae bacterium]|nr:glycine zipper family protein [Paracoccaceae bacterium]
MKRKIAITVAMLALAACTPPQPVTEYRPVVDLDQPGSESFETDLRACRNIALQVQARYEERQRQEAGNILAGAVIGAAVGHAVGGRGHYQNELAWYGAAVGASSAAESSVYGHDMVHYGPRRVIDRCMHNRGHVVLNDLGFG